MTDEEIRIKIAEACGWKFKRHKVNLGDIADSIVWETGWVPPRDTDPNASIPDYLNDLNAMQSALVHAYKTQPAGWAQKFEDNLTEVCSKRQYPHWHVWCAQARDLAGAFIKTLNLEPK